jgi:choice-of-anchor B domain-containing protein
MKKILFLFFLFLLIPLFTKAQLPNHNMVLLSNIHNYSGYSACWGYVAPNGREYAILGHNSGTSFYDITDSSNIVQVGFISGVNSGWREMKTYLNYAYIVSEGTNSQLQIVDLQYLPDSVRLVKVWGYPGYTKTHTISQSGHYLYLNGGNASPNGGVKILDVIDPENPVQRGQWTTRYVHDCRVVNDTIYAMNINSSDGQITVINAVNKDNLTTVAQWHNLPNPSPHNCDLTADRKYLLATDEVGNLPRLLKIWNIEDLSNPTLVATWQPTGITTSRVHNVERYGTFAVIAHYTAGIRMVNIADPANPYEVAWYDTYPSSNNSNYNGCWGVYMFPSRKIIGSDMSNGLFVVKPTTTTNISNHEISEISGYSLDQNYPNPFNPVTKINFTIDRNSEVELNVFDITGKNITQLVNDKRDGGSYEIIFDSNKFNLSSGVYFYTLKVSNKDISFTDTKKLMLLK